MDVKPSLQSQSPTKRSKPLRKKLTPSQIERSADDATPLKVPEELLEGGPKQPLLNTTSSEKQRSKKKWILGVLATIIIIILGLIGGALWWYNDALQPKSSTFQRVHVTIQPGATPDQIAQKLQDQGVIKSSLAFRVLIKQDGNKPLQAGKYLFSPTQPAREVLAWLVGGRVDAFNVTIAPGQTLAQIKQALIQDGFAAADIDGAFAKTYNHPLLATKPANVNLEGYIYPETYQASSETTAEQLLIRAFDEFYAQIQAKDLVSQLSARGLSLHQGITLASIVQMEVSGDSDRRQVAQVFEKRLKDDISLGSDVTYIYAASLTGQTPSPDLDSPYNTRKNKGLPPGAIANFTLGSLQAVANPAAGDYLFFVAGEDGKTYFARTDAEHQENIKKYCGSLCSQ
jgi:UPF0755 protein